MATAAAELPHVGEDAIVRDGPRGGDARHCSGRAQAEGVTSALGRKTVVGQRLFGLRARRGSRRPPR
ncbi:AI-2E family transporter [Sesbania bispinosa]|nr:AI-2E family transporter [Sesbania bispinosa]